MADNSSGGAFWQKSKLWPFQNRRRYTEKCMTTPDKEDLHDNKTNLQAPSASGEDMIDKTFNEGEEPIPYLLAEGNRNMNSVDHAIPFNLEKIKRPTVDQLTVIGHTLLLEPNDDWAILQAQIKMFIPPDKEELDVERIQKQMKTTTIISETLIHSTSF